MNGDQEQPAGWVREAVQRRQTARDQLHRRLFPAVADADERDDDQPPDAA